MLKKFNDKIKNISDKLDIKKRFPGYFHLWVFRSAFVFCGILFMIMFVTNNFQLSYSFAQCPVNSKEDCINPYRTCENFYDENCIQPADVTSDIRKMCGVSGCNSTLQPGERIGTAPNTLGKYYEIICLSLVGFAFIINHLLYRRKKNVFRY